MATINSKMKGKVGERELANLLKEHGYDARRAQQYCGYAGDADVLGLDGIHIECKRTERLSLYKAMEQAKRDAVDGDVPMVFHRRNREKWLVIMEIDDFLDLYKRSRDE